MIEVVVVAEAATDADMVGKLADRVLLEGLEWVEAELLDSYRRWASLDGSKTFSTWVDVKALGQERGLRFHGKWGQAGTKGEYVQARKAMELARREEATALLLHRDSDGDRGRRDDYALARREHGRVPTCLAVPHPESEAWYLIGFQPVDDTEGARLAALEQDLGFDPTRHADRLNPKRTADRRGAPVKRSTKRVLKELLADDSRRRRCIEEPPLDLMFERGAATGLAPYLDDVRTLLLPLMGG